MNVFGIPTVIRGWSFDHQIQVGFGGTIVQASRQQGYTVDELPSFPFQRSSSLEAQEICDESCRVMCKRLRLACHVQACLDERSNAERATEHPLHRDEDKQGGTTE